MSKQKIYIPVDVSSGELPEYGATCDVKYIHGTEKTMRAVFIGLVNNIPTWLEDTDTRPKKIYPYEWLKLVEIDLEALGKDKWIDVKDETPIAYKSGNFDGKQSDLVLTKDENTGKRTIALLYEGYMDGNHFKDWYDENDFEITTPTHWQKLP